MGADQSGARAGQRHHPVPRGFPPRHRRCGRNCRAHPEEAGPRSFPHSRPYRMPVADAERGARRPVLHVAHAGTRGRRHLAIHHG
ncbi:hypothetical protein G6F31_015442 [Rhizopus arrhizus]|nr:hypothetical protein G6F31_015442 [Rhizopus arrhizus]